MGDFHFYNTGCDDPRGLRRLSVFCRRLLRRLLRPIFQRQVEIFEQMAGDISVLDRHYGDLRCQVENLARRQDDLVEGLARRMQGAFAAEASRDDQALQDLRNEVRAEQQAEFARFRRDLERYVSDCNAVVQRLSLLDEHMERLLGHPVQSRNAA